MQIALYSVRFFLVLLLVVAVPCATFAQAPPILWQRCYGGGDKDAIYCIKQSNEGGYIAAGYTLSTNGDLAANGGTTGLWVLKLDLWGNIQWERTYSDTLGASSWIEPTTDGGYILTTNNHVIKLHTDGSIEWMNNMWATKVHQTSDGGYICCYDRPSNLTKLKADGSVSWQQVLSSNGYGLLIYDVCQSYTDRYIISGVDYDLFPSPFVSKTDSLGIVTIPVFPDVSHGSSGPLCGTNDGHYCVIYTSNHKEYVAKIDDNCNQVWVDTLTSVSFAAIAATQDHGIIGIGGGGPTPGDIGVAVYDGDGHLKWSRTMGGSMSEEGWSGFQAANGNCLAAGTTWSNDGDVSGNHGGQDGWVVAFGTNVGVPGVTTPPASIQAYPLPATTTLYVDLPDGYETATIKLTDISGRTVVVKEDNTGLSRVLHLDDLTAGAYLLQVINNGTCTSRKIIHY